MNIGLYFGSFNPIHTGHLIIANHILNATNLHRVWFVVSPQNPFKVSATLLNEYHRLHLVQKAIDGDDRLRASDIEFSLPKPSYTVHTLAYLSEKYPEHQFAIIMGSDGWMNLKDWKNAQTIIDNYPIYVYQRPGFVVTDIPGAKLQVLSAPLLDIAATHIRQLIADGKSIRYLVTAPVEEEISRSGFYKPAKKSSQ